MPIYFDKEKKTYRIVVRYKDTFGKSKQTTIRRNDNNDVIKTLKEAKKIERDFLTASENQFNGDITFDELFKSNLTMFDTAKRSKANKLNKYDKHIRPFFGELKVKNIKPYQILALQKRLTESLGANSAQAVYELFKSIIVFGVTYHGLKENPCHKLPSLKRADTKVGYITISELSQITPHFRAKSEITKRYYVLLAELLFFTGARVGEALALNWGDIDEKGEIKIERIIDTMTKEVAHRTKTKNGTRLIAPPTALLKKLDDLKKWQEKNIYEWEESMFIFGAQKSIDYSAFRKAYVKAQQKAGLQQTRVHDLRHSFATFSIACNVDVYTLRDLMGHGDIRITINTYGHMYPEKRNVAKAQHLKEIDKSGYKF